MTTENQIPAESQTPKETQAPAENLPPAETQDPTETQPSGENLPPAETQDPAENLPPAEFQAHTETQAPAPEIEPLSPTDERTWAMLSHLTVLLNLVTGFLGPIAAFILYLVFKDRSRYVAYHALQSAIFQSLWWLAGGLLGGILIAVVWTITGLLSALLIGLCFIPIAILLTILLASPALYALIYGVIGAIQVNQGRDFRYWLVGDWVRGTLTG